MSMNKQNRLLSNFLSSEKVPEGCLDYIAAHGFLTGIVCGPESLIDRPYMQALFDGEPVFTGGESAKVHEAINSLMEKIEYQLYTGEPFDFPMPLKLPEQTQTNETMDWCFGFMEAVALDEELWFPDETMEEAVSSLILPIGIISSVFDGSEIEALQKDKKLMNRLLKQLPDNLTQIYLLYRE